MQAKPSPLVVPILVLLVVSGILHLAMAIYGPM